MYSLQIGKNARNALFSVCVCVCVCVCVEARYAHSGFVAKQYVAHSHHLQKQR